MQIFLGKELAPYNTQKSYTYINLKKKGLKFCIFSSLIVWISYIRKGEAPPCNPQIIYT